MGFWSKEPQFEASVCKANLKMAVGRAKIHQNKAIAITKSMQREVAVLLKEGERFIFILFFFFSFFHSRDSRSPSLIHAAARSGGAASLEEGERED
jgi:hypothetical protein